MKLSLFLIGISAAVFLGYSMEPSMRLSLTGKKPGGEKQAGTKEVIIDLQNTPPNIDPSKYPQDLLPKKITLKGEVEFSDSASDLTMKVAAGSKVDLIRVYGSHVVISPGVDNLQGSIPISATDLIELLAALPVPAPIPGAEIMAKPEPEVTAEPESEVTVEPEPEITVEPEPEAPAVPVDVVATMKASIEAGEIKEFNFDQVVEWKAAEEEETFDGETYKVGLLTYKAETFVGVRTIQAKALIKDHKVARWLWPKSGMEIK